MVHSISFVFLAIFLLNVSVRSQNDTILPAIGELIERAYPTWCIDRHEGRLREPVTCADGSPNGRFSPLYFTKQFSGAEPTKGGYPTNIDIQYAFEFAAPFFGQACAGGSHHCDELFDGTTMNCQACPKVVTDDDSGPYGPGHVPPHIALAATAMAYEEGVGGDVSDWFNFEQNGCRILPTVLLTLIRNYYPREEDGSVYYPPPFSEAGGSYPLEFVNLSGETCEEEKAKHPDAGDLICFEDHSGSSEYPEYLEVGHGSPHYCTTEGVAADVNKDWCPYIFFGPNRGKYRHPHIAFSSLETYLANMYMPDMCASTWDDSNYPARPDTTGAFPDMEGGFPKLDGWGVSQLRAPEQATITSGNWTWPGLGGTMRKPVAGLFVTDLYIVKNEPLGNTAATVSKEGGNP